MKEPKGYSARLWKQYADLGLLAVPFAEEHGGLGRASPRP
jgi:alkylation response protein AidB-like acyl-CoA dehydrogenase